MSTKAYVLDTNILLESPKAIFGFDDNIVLITSTTLQELDSKKNKPGELGYNARECCRILEKLREENDNLLNGISINRKGDNYGILKILTCFTKHSLLPDGYSLDIPDNKIINTILKYESDIIENSYKLKRDVVLNKRFLTKADETPSKIVLVTNDISMRINASVCGLDVQSYHNDEIRVEKEYLGRSLLEVNEGEFNELLTNGFIEYYSENKSLEENEFIEVKCGNRKETTIHKDGLIKKIDIKNIFNVTPKNIAQKFALYALSAPVDEIPIVILKGSAGCVDKDTEFFNGKEWKPISEWEKSDKVLQFNTDTNEASLVTPNAYIKLPCDDMIHFETKYGINQTLSLDHNMIVYGYSKKTKKYTNLKEFKTEEFIKLHQGHNPNLKFKTTFDYSGKGIDLTDDEIKLMCAVICDGTFNKNNLNSKRCTLNLKKERKHKQAEELLNSMGIKYRKTIMGNGYIRYMFDAPRREKEFSDYWYNCTNHQLQIICDNILKWDGSEKNGRKTFTQANKKTIDFIQFAFAACGYRTSVKEARFKGEVKITNGKEYKRKNNLYHISITKRNMVGITSDYRKEHSQTNFIHIKPSDGYKYCFNVPTHALVLRRKGNIFITGNCAKTFLSLAAGLDATYNQNKENTYDKLLITRNNSQIHGEEFGYLPGSIEEKMMPLLSPFMDNIESLLRNSCINESNEQIQMQIDDMFNSGIVDVCPVAYMRGRSITHSYLIVDECQNATRSQMRDIITRIGAGTKLVLCGDPEQIDNHLLDKWNNGLTFASERMKGSPLCAQITFTEKECVRSDLAKDALKRLNL